MPDADRRLRPRLEKIEWRWETEQLKERKAQFLATAMARIGRTRGQDHSAPCRAGFGDTIQFCRYVPLRRGARRARDPGGPEPLRALMSTLARRGADRVAGANRCPISICIARCSACRWRSGPGSRRYRRRRPICARRRRRRWIGRAAGPGHRPRIGLAWSGQPAHKNDHNRSIGLSSLLPLWRVSMRPMSVCSKMCAQTTRRCCKAERPSPFRRGA